LTELAERCGADSHAWDLTEDQFADAERSGQAQRMVPALAARARLTARRDGAAAALPIFREALRRTVNERGRGSHWMFSPEAAWALAAAGDLSELDAWVADISALTTRDRHPNNQAADQLCRAAQAAAGGRPDEARRLLEEVAVAFHGFPYPAREVEALVQLADVAHRMEDREVAVATARRAHQVAHSLGAARLVEVAADAMDRTEGSAVLATVVFTDIVGSTERAAQLGDVAWRELLERHNTIVRRELDHHGGREIDTAGDGFLIAFDSPARAVRFAAAVTGAVPTIGIEVRAGIHTGECRAAGPKLTGLAVHIASRIASMAHGGEVLVSSTVRDLVAGSGMAFVDRGVHPLRGIPDEWHLFRLA
jgi:class 3 adenylate cyclase